MTYTEKLQDPRWKKRRLQILDRDEWACQNCMISGVVLHVHHIAYRMRAEPWDYPDHMLVPLCAECHGSAADETYSMVEAIMAARLRLGPFAPEHLAAVGALFRAMPPEIATAVCAHLGDPWGPYGEPITSEPAP